jgi:hypothetical protein
MHMDTLAAPHEGAQLMLRRFPFLCRFVSRPFYGMLPAAIASVVGVMLFSHYSRPSIAVPAVAIGTPAGAEMMQMVRDEHALIISYLHEYTEARQQTNFAAEQEMLRSKAAEQAAMIAAREARAAETKALAIAVRVVAKPERKVAAKQPAEELYTAAVGKPLQLVNLASVTTQIQPVGPSTMQPARFVTPATGSRENAVKAKFYEVTAMVERIPLWVRSVSGWFPGDVLSRRVLQLRTGLS